MITYYDNYLYGFETNTIDNKALYNDCMRAEQVLDKYWPMVDDVGWYGNKTSSANPFYSLLTFPTKNFNQLYHLLVENISPILEKEKTYMIKSWMNIYRKGQSVKMHKHWPEEIKSWHGFYCVNVGENESETVYKFPNNEKEIHVTSKNGLIVVGKSAGDKHRSSVWEKSDSDRITLAFDILPYDKILFGQINHWIPFKL